jgi:predicted RND superfamily exporter protein
MPILLESSSQAQFVIPTAVSISFGIIFATVITLFLIPSLYLLQEDGFAWARRARLRIAGEPVGEKAPDKPTA